MIKMMMTQKSQSIQLGRRGWVYSNICLLLKIWQYYPLIGCDGGSAWQSRRIAVYSVLYQIILILSMCRCVFKNITRTINTWPSSIGNTDALVLFDLEQHSRLFRHRNMKQYHCSSYFGHVLHCAIPRLKCSITNIPTGRIYEYTIDDVVNSLSVSL